MLKCAPRLFQTAENQKTAENSKKHILFPKLPIEKLKHTKSEPY